MMMAPTTAMAEIALVRDIRGVCRSGETRRMIPRPRNVLSRRIIRKRMIWGRGAAVDSARMGTVVSMWGVGAGLGRGNALGLEDSGVDDLSVLGHEGFADDFVGGVDFELALLHEEGEKGGDVL